ncbi:MAG: hypothetical protein LBL98_03915 [Ruminococcus sp.]|nr:hypothetical protein [Ruminococcus sp.]
MKEDKKTLESDSLQLNNELVNFEIAMRLMPSLNKMYSTIDRIIANDVKRINRIAASSTKTARRQAGV